LETLARILSGWVFTLVVVSNYSPSIWGDDTRFLQPFYTSEIASNGPSVRFKGIQLSGYPLTRPANQIACNAFLQLAILGNFVGKLYK
jgi:hypothetical protein